MVHLEICGAHECLLWMSVNWTLFRSPGMWDKFGLDWILGKGYRLFKFIGKFRDGIRHLPQEFLVDNNYILGLVWENDSKYLFDSHSKDENGN